MRVAIVSTFPPRACGIGTFSADLQRSLARVAGIERVDVVAVGDDVTAGAPVIATIRQQVRQDYARAARLLRRRSTDVVIIEHEFGIFGGADGEYVVTLADELEVPFVVTLHTVLRTPSNGQAAVLSRLCAGAAAVQVFTTTAERIVEELGLAARGDVHVVPHGAPPEVCAVNDGRSRPVPVPLPGLSGGVVDTGGRFVVSTFGLLSEGKGVDIVLDAVAKVVTAHPEVLFVVAGRTHPEVAKADGERYRLLLHERVDELGLAAHVAFDDRFLSVEELAELLGASDLFVTAYRSSDQIVSGALTFAVAAGVPVVSTPYLYARDLLAGGGGRLVPFEDAGALAAAIEELVERPQLLARLRRVAATTGAELSWPAVAGQTAELLGRSIRRRPTTTAPLLAEPGLPALRTHHLAALVDDVGIIQFARGSIPDRASGYCVDDVARLLPVAHHLAIRTGKRRWRLTCQRALSFLWHAVDGDGLGMHNLMEYDRRWSDTLHVGDHLGRSLWALGTILRTHPATSIAEPTTMLLQRLAVQLGFGRPSPRTAAFALLGLAEHRALLDRRGVQLVDDLADLLAGEVATHGGPEDWHWFEDCLRYDNARLPQALIVAGRELGDRRLTDLGLTTLAWYGDECHLDDVLRLPGHAGRPRGCPHPGAGDEQPLEAAALVDAELAAFEVTGDNHHARRAWSAFEWFLGRNGAGLVVYDPATGGCHDGLGTTVNLNEGAESTLAYLAARLAVEAAGLGAVGRRAKLSA